MLSKRCRDLCVRDLVIERDMLTGSMCTKPFSACGLTWEVYLDPPPANQTSTEVKIHLKIGKHANQRQQRLQLGKLPIQHRAYFFSTIPSLLCCVRSDIAQAQDDHRGQPAHGDGQRLCELGMAKIMISSV